MSADEHAIRDLIANWHRLTATGDIDAVLQLMSEDVVFLVAGQAPFGREKFETGLRALLCTHRIDSSGEVKEIQVADGIAYCWSYLEVRIYPLTGGTPTTRAGNVLSILRKHTSGAWQVARDANMLVVSSGT